MSFRLGLSPRIFTPLKLTSSLGTRSFFSNPAPLRVLSRTAPRPNVRLYTLGLGLSFLAFQSLSPNRKLHCESPHASSIFSANSARPQPEVFGGDPPSSKISAYQLGFGSIAGICTGVFLKKGLKAIAFLLGGAFVLLQVGQSTSLVPGQVRLTPS